MNKMIDKLRKMKANIERKNRSVKKYHKNQKIMKKVIENLNKQEVNFNLDKWMTR